MRKELRTITTDILALGFRAHQIEAEETKKEVLKKLLKLRGAMEAVYTEIRELSDQLTKDIVK